MCILSVVYDYFGEKPDYYWTLEKIDNFRQGIIKARELDRIMEQPDCQDPEKTKLLDILESANWI